jgi:hypothetical protein
MKFTNNHFFWNGLIFLSGCLITYYATQYEYLNIETDVNVIESIISIFGILVGLFIAVSLQKRYNRNQNLYTYLVNRLDLMWSDFVSFHSTIEESDKIEFFKVTKVVTDLQRRNTELKKLISHLEGVPNQIDSLTDSLQDLFDKCLKKDGIVYYDPKKKEILQMTESVNNSFVVIFKAINKILA